MCVIISERKRHTQSGSEVERDRTDRVTHGRDNEVSVDVVWVPEHSLDLVLAAAAELPVRLQPPCLPQVHHCQPFLTATNTQCT